MERSGQPDASRTERRLPTPQELRRRLGIPSTAATTVGRGRAAVRGVLRGDDRQRLLVVVGPCSIHDPAGAIDYAERLGRVAGPLSAELVVVMRTFLEKPRTRGGWKGLINDPDLDGSCDLARGLRTARSLLLQINARGIPCASELLEPFTLPYVADLLSWGGVGARTTESAVHRQLASGAPFPVGFKNGTDGDLDAALNAVEAARHPQAFPAVATDGTCVVREAPGNPDAHLVLRGGRTGPNFDAASIEAAHTRLASDPARPVLVDCAHGNSQGDPRRQVQACRSVLESWREGSAGLLGVMLESYLEEGRQALEPARPLRYGVSVTDPCLGWNETADLLCEAAEAVKLSR